MILKCCVYDFERLFNDFEMNFNDLSTSLNNFGSLKKHTEWGGGLRLPPHFKLIGIFDFDLNIFIFVSFIS